MFHTQTSLTGKRWVFRDVKEKNMHISTPEDIQNMRSFPDIPLIDPYVFPDTPKICERIWHAVRTQEAVGIFGDYDCDGVTASAQLIRFCRRHGVEPSIRLPHREHDGYGIKPQHIDEFYERHCTLLLVVDTGISAHETTNHAKKYGMDTVIIDHHTPKNTLPDAFGIIHQCTASPPLLSSPCAAGLTFALIRSLEVGTWDEYAEDLALACIGTVADLVELRGENRALVQKGLSALRTLRSGPIASFIQSVCTEQTQMNSADIGFRLAPRINAAGRMDTPLHALHALLEGGEHIAVLEKLNAERRQQTRELFTYLIETLPDPLPSCIVCASPLFPAGIIGLLAGKLTELYGRPSLVATCQEGYCTASLRSPGCYNITEGLQRIAHLLSSFGGHAQAAGCTFAEDQLHAVRQALITDVEHHVPPEELRTTLSLDACISPAHISVDMCAALQSLEPFGSGNPEPLFLIEQVTLSACKRVGTDQTHLSACLGPTRCIGFGMGNLLDQLHQPVDLVCTLELHTWNSRTSPQLHLKDIALSYTGTNSPSISNTSVTDTSNAAAIL